MATSKEGTRIALDPKIQELYARLEEERERNKRLQEENTFLARRISHYETTEVDRKPTDTQKTVAQTKKKFALQEQLNEKKLQDEIISNQKQRIDSLVESLSDNQEVQDLDSKSIAELKSALDALIDGREKRKEIIKKLSDKNNALMEENEDLKFTRTKLAHDLRSLMSSILGTLSLADFGELEAMESLVPLLKDRCNVFINLLSAINDNAINKEPITLKSIVPVLCLSTEETEEIISIAVEGEDIEFVGDRAGVYNVIQNLINNSVKYSGVEIADLVISISVSREGPKTIIQIADNGQGIARDKQAKIFDLYNRAGLTDKNGKGIGLYMVRKIVERHEGTIHYDDKYQSGARFVVTLPNE